MPIVNLTILEGKSDEKIETTIKKVADAVHEGLDVPYSTIRVIVDEIPANRASVGNTLFETLNTK